MSSTTDKIKGYANEAAGNIKQGVGKVVGSEKLQAEGIAQELKGDAQQTVANVKDAANDAYTSVSESSTITKVKGYANEAAGKAKQSVARVVGSEELEVDGLVQEAKGSAQKAVGDVKKRLDR